VYEDYDYDGLWTRIPFNEWDVGRASSFIRQAVEKYKKENPSWETLGK